MDNLLLRAREIELNDSTHVSNAHISFPQFNGKTFDDAWTRVHCPMETVRDAETIVVFWFPQNSTILLRTYDLFIESELIQK